MALAAGTGKEGSVKAAEGAAQRSEQRGEPLQVPTGRAKKPHEAGARDKGKKFRQWSDYLARGAGVAGRRVASLFTDYCLMGYFGALSSFCKHHPKATHDVSVHQNY